VRRVITEQSYDAAPFQSVLGLLEKYGTIERVRIRALDYIENATVQLTSLPESNYKRALYSVTEWVVDRES
jgi:geranylgeranyl pyrophosphate synthase